MGANYGAVACDAVEIKGLDEQKWLVSANECNLYGYDVLNLDASVRYIHFFDVAATASVTVGTTAPDLVVPIGSSEHLVVPPLMPLKHFSNGIVAIMKTANTTAGSTGPTVDAPSVFYKK